MLDLIFELAHNFGFSDELPIHKRLARHLGDAAFAPDDLHLEAQLVAWDDRAAEALDCTVVYALVPRKPLERTVRERARTFLQRRKEAIEHSMLLEDQRVTEDSQDVEALIDEIVRETNPRLFWD